MFPFICLILEQIGEFLSLRERFSIEILFPFHKLLHNILIIFYPINTFTMTLISQVTPNRSISQDDVRISQRENRTDGNSCISTWLSSQAKSGRPWSMARDDPRERRTSRERISTAGGEDAN